MSSIIYTINIKGRLLRMNRFMQRLYDFMYGRYGVDKLTAFLVLLHLLLNGIGSFMRNRAVYFTFLFLALGVLVFAIFRTLSKNIDRRRREGEWFDNLLVRTNYTEHIRSFRRWCKRQALRIKFFKTHRFRVCPCCKENLRLSKKRGKREITCPKCGNRFTVHILF